MGRSLRIASVALTGLMLIGGNPASARSPETDARAGMMAFAENCFSPFMTAQKAEQVFGPTNLRYDFYDLAPVSNVAPSPVVRRAATPGTDRRCEVSFVGDRGEKAAEVAVAALEDEGITTPADVPPSFMPTSGTTLLAARKLNPRRIAVVHVGTRSDANGIQETFMSVERLVPLDN